MPDKLTERKFTQPSTAALRFLLSVRYFSSLFFVLIFANEVLSSLPIAYATVDNVANVATADYDDTSTEIVQLPHAFRHQGHYSHRIEQAVNSFKTAQQTQYAYKFNDQQHSDTIETTAATTAAATTESNENLHRLRPMQVNEKLQPIEYHKRHEHHSKYQQHGTAAHHLRHHHTNHQNSKILSNQNNNPWIYTTRGPDLAKTYENNKKPAQVLFTSANHYMHNNMHSHDDVDAEHNNDENEESFNDYEFPDEKNRISLPLSNGFKGMENFNSSYDNDFYDDYLYDESKVNLNTGIAFRKNQNKIDEIQNTNKAAVKRFTNPFQLFYSKSKFDNKLHTNLRPSDEHVYQRDFDNVDDDDSDDNTNEFSNAKWNKIEYEHHLKQLQHQKDMQKLRHTILPQNKQQPDSDNNLEYQHSEYYTPGALSHQKQLELGTIDAVHKSRLTHASGDIPNKALAKAHVSKMQREAICRIPQPRVQRVQQDPSKIYLPHCTMLHRCGDDTGCCRAQHQTCVAKHSHKVDLYFFTKRINDKKGTIERFSFINHTECHCVDKLRHHHQIGNNNNNTRLSIDDAHSILLQRASIINCNCPKLYEKILQDDGYCRCDCSSGNTGCDRLKRGKEHFAMDDRKCIVEGRCKLPTCEYGNFTRKYGRCPRREEQLIATLGSATTNDLSAKRQH